MTSLTTAIPFKNVLVGSDPFYYRKDYLKRTRIELCEEKSLREITYSWESESAFVRSVKKILSIIIFPIALYQLFHAFLGYVAFLPAAFPFQSNIWVKAERRCLKLSGIWKYKRITVDVDGQKIDAMIVGKPHTFGNGRWVLHSNGNGEFYADNFNKWSGFHNLLTDLDANALVFNYPAVGASGGTPSRENMAKAYRALLSFLEDKEKGIGAKEIIGYGHSMGGGVQGDALLAHELKKDVKYVFVKSRTYSTMSAAAGAIAGFLCRPLVYLFGWNIDTLRSSRTLQAPEIILQTADVKYPQILHEPSKILHDQLIAREASLAKAVLADSSIPKKKKLIIGIPEDHNTPIENVGYLAGMIRSFI